MGLGELDTFAEQVRSSVVYKVYYFTLALMYLMPALIGIFWGAPLIARELETGTHRLAFNQSITRTRWLATKLTIIGGASVVSVGLLSWAVTAWAHHFNNRMTPLVYGARGIVPISYALFAFALGVALGMLVRRTVPAMAATLVIYVPVRLGLRQDLTYQPASHFWALQWAETGIFTAAAVLLVGFCFWWTRRRLT